MAVLLFLVATLAHNLYGQTWNSHLEGIVLDPSGAAVPATALELRNPATGQVRHTQTDANGFYSFPFLPVGNYELEIAKTGFVSKVVRGWRSELEKQRVSTFGWKSHINESKSKLTLDRPL